MSGVDKLRQEIDGYYSEMGTFDEDSPAIVFRKLAAMTARASFIRTRVVRAEAQNRAFTAFRTKELDPFLSECDRQFKVWSRYVSVLNLESSLEK